MKKHSKGAVTVFVTLLLIPAILVSGTGVDLSRIYAARSTTRDANQLAANALLTNYDALLQDLYGLYAVIGDDDDLVAMVDLYVKASLFGEDVTDAQLGEFRLFGGQESVSTAVSASAPLSNVEVLRHQIEEYSKYRVPVAIVSDILDRLKDSGSTEMGASTEAASRKLAVDEQVEAVVVKFAEVLKKAEWIHDEYKSAELTTYRAINDIETRIAQQLSDLLAVRREYESSPDERDDLLDHYNAIIENIRRLGVTGGRIEKDWEPAHVDDNGNDVPGAWKNLNITTVGLKKLYEDRKNFQGFYRDQLDDLVELCEQADAAKSELAQRIVELEAQLNSGNCSAELVANMKEEIETYKKLLDIDFTKLGQEHQKRATDYMDQISTMPLDSIEGFAQGPEISFSDMDRLENIPGFYIDLNTNPTYQDNSDSLSHAVEGGAIYTYEAPGGYLGFRETSPDHEACCKLLEELDLAVKSEDEELSDNEKTEKGKFTEGFKKLKQLWDGLTDYDPAPGAGSYPSSAAAGSWAFSTRGAGMELDFGTSDFKVESSGNQKEQEKGMRSTLKTFAGLVTGKTDAAELFSNALANGANRVLLVGYATQMFSNWSYKYTYTGADTPKSLTGQSINAANNYFYNSEWEYLFNGNLDAGKNLGKATMTILAVRFLANYASSYMISDINREIRIMEGAVSAIPFAGGALRFLVRPLYVLGESLVDVSLLRTGHGLPLLKTELKDWKFALSKLGELVIEGPTGDTEGEKQKGLLYSDYLVVFLLVSDPDVLASRIGDLIALNVTTLKNSLPEKAKGNADARAEAASSASLFDLSKANTTFAVTTQTEVRFMFLSMSFAQQGINGIVPPTTFPVVVTDYRGY